MEFSELKGKVFSSIENINNEELLFTTIDKIQYRLLHHQVCCENVRIEDIEGNLDDLLNSEILLAEEINNAEPNIAGSVTKKLLNEPEPSGESHTWTFYKLATIKGYVTIRWLGESNGYYSERVDFEMVPTN